MKIGEIVVHSVVAPLGRAFWMSLEPYTAASELVVQARTDDGLTGIGEIHGRSSCAAEPGRAGNYSDSGDVG